jgi:hypothetical protein
MVLNGFINGIKKVPNVSTSLATFPEEVTEYF